MQGLSRQMAVDYAQHAVRINCVSPGGIETGLNANSQLLEKEFLPKTAAPVRNQITRDTADPESIALDYDPTPRLFVQGLPMDVAYTILFLASDESVHITGQNLMVDGGSSIAAGAVPGIKCERQRGAERELSRSCSNVDIQLPHVKFSAARADIRVVIAPFGDDAQR